MDLGHTWVYQATETHIKWLSTQGQALVNLSNKLYSLYFAKITMYYCITAHPLENQLIVFYLLFICFTGGVQDSF